MSAQRLCAVVMLYSRMSVCAHFSIFFFCLLEAGLSHQAEFYTGAVSIFSVSNVFCPFSKMLFFQLNTLRPY